MYTALQSCLRSPCLCNCMGMHGRKTAGAPRNSTPHSVFDVRGVCYVVNKCFFSSCSEVTSKRNCSSFWHAGSGVRHQRPQAARTWQDFCHYSVQPNLTLTAGVGTGSSAPPADFKACPPWGDQLCQWRPHCVSGGHRAVLPAAFVTAADAVLGARAVA